VAGAGGTTIDGVKVSWNPPPPLVEFTEGGYRKTGDTDFIYDRVDRTASSGVIAPLQPNTSYEFRVRHVSIEGVAGPYSTASITTGTTTSMGTAVIADNAITTAKIDGGAVTNAKLDPNAVAANVFAAGVQPIGIAATVPLSRTVDTIFVTADAKLYRWNGTAYVKSVDNDDIVSIVADKITAGTINAAITTTNILQLSTNGKIYTAGKTSAASATAGVFLGHDGGTNYDFAVGDGTKSMIYDGSAGTLTIKGDLAVGSIIAGAVTVNGTQLETTRASAAAALPAANFDTTLDSSLAAGVGYIISGEGGDYRLNVGASSVVAKHKDASELGVSAYVGTLRTGLIVTANGIGMGYNRKDTGAWVTAVAIDSTGNIVIRGDISATTGTFAGVYSGTVTAGQITTGTLSAAVTTTNNLILSTAGKIYTAGKTSAASTTAGVFLGHDGGSNYDFAVGDGTKSIVWDGSAGTFTITGEVVVLGSLAANTSKTYDSGNFAFEMGTNTEISGYQGAGIFSTQKNFSFAFGATATGSDSFALAGQSTNNAGAGYGGAFVNSTAVGGETHRTEAYLASSAQSGIFLHTSTANQVILSNATYAIDTDGDVNVDGDITATGSITPFTGSHDGVMLNTVVPEPGDILVDTQIIARSGISEALARMVISSTANQPAIGVYTGDRIVSYLPNSISEHSAPIHVAGNTYIPGPRVLRPEFADLLDDSRIIGCNSVGEGLINVCGQNGNIAAGDLIITSDVLGKGMRQDDDIIRAKTVARAREAVSFDDPDDVHMISCIYLCG
jgi:hypothetical protein